MRTEESGKEKRMLPARPSDEPDLKAINRLMKDLQGTDKKASKCAFEALVRLGSPIRELLASPQCDPCWDGPYSYDDMAAVINEAGLSDANVLAGLAQAVVGPGGDIRLAAIQVCKRIKPPHAIVLDALAKALGDRRKNIRAEAARALGEFRVAAPSVLKGLAAALRDSDPNVVFQVTGALEEIGAPSPEVLAGLVHLLDGNAGSCGWALHALRRIGAFDQSVHNAVRQVANSTFSFPAKQPNGYGDDYEWWRQGYENAERLQKANREQAVELLSWIPVEPMVQEAIASTKQQPILSAEDQRILAWFKVVDLTDYLTPLQVFWCIGQVDRAAVESEGPAMGYSRLQRKLSQLRPTYAEIRLNTSNGYIRQGCLDVVYGLLDKEPFYSNAWAEDERGMEFRVPYMRGGREEGQWTGRARKAFHYVDRFLSIMKCLPKMTVTDG